MIKDNTAEGQPNHEMHLWQPILAHNNVLIRTMKLCRVLTST